MMRPTLTDPTRALGPSLAADLIAEHDMAASRRCDTASPANRRRPWIAAALVAMIVVCSVFVTRQFASIGDTPGAGTRIRVAIDAETGEVFPKYRIHIGQSQPWPHPRTGKPTLYPAEACFWTRDGQAKIEPTYVLLNELLGIHEPTVCPDCGLRVVPRNPMPPMDVMARAANREPT